MQRTATAVWSGTGKEGGGTLSTQSGAITNMPYNWKARFGDAEGKSGTNPEELIAAAHSGCFTMSVAFGLVAAGHTAEELKTVADLTVENPGGGFVINKVVLRMEARVPGITNEAFQAIAQAAKEKCPVSRALNATIELQATLL